MRRFNDGESVTANYHDELVSGTVLSSRVRYGGMIQYTVKLDKPVQFRWRQAPTDTVLINADKMVDE